MDGRTDGVSGHGKNFNGANFSDTIKVKDVKLCMFVLLIELYPFMPLLLVTLSTFHGHSSVSLN